MPACFRLWLIVAATLLTGCPNRWAEFRVIRLDAAGVSAIDGAGFDMRLSCRVKNPNSVDATISGLSFTASIDRYRLGSGRWAGGTSLSIKAHSEFTLEVPVRVRFENLPPDLPRRVRDGSLSMSVDARFVAKTSLGSFDMHLVSNNRTAINKALSVGIKGAFEGDALKIRSVDISSLSLTSTLLSFEVTARNHFPFPITLRRASYQVAINGNRFGTGTFEETTKLAPRKATVLTLPLRATYGAILRGLAAMAGADPRFRARGAVEIEPIAGVDRLPFDLLADATIFAD